jgi:N-acetylglucosaminyldiphosphoundecaprenol N-acetyl-beta-D-mannosaminyltransferase
VCVTALGQAWGVYFLGQCQAVLARALPWNFEDPPVPGLRASEAFAQALQAAQEGVPRLLRFGLRQRVMDASRSERCPSMRTKVFGIEIDPIGLRDATEQVLRWAQGEAIGRLVVTPNLDHALLLRESVELRAAYTSAALILADGQPLVWASRLGSSQPLAERVTGSDLVPAVLKEGAALGLRVFLFGAAEGVAERAALIIGRSYPGILVVGHESPPFGFERDASLCHELSKRVAATRPDVLVVGLGAPKQEIWAHRYASELGAKVIICAGATIDFLSGQQQRAPVWFQRHGLEWLYRAYREPGRLGLRYARNAKHLPRLLWSQLRS